MMDSMRNKWILTGFLWSAVVLITLYNASEIKRLKLAREEMETLRMDEQFWQQHSESIAGISAEGNRLFLDIESVDLGLLTIDNRHQETFIGPAPSSGNTQQAANNGFRGSGAG